MAYRHKKKWMGTITLGGKRYRKTFSEKKYALMWEQQKAREHELGILNIGRNDTTQVSELTDRYMSDIKTRLSKGSIDSEKVRIGNLTNYCIKAGAILASDLDKAFWYSYIEYLKSRGQKEVTINGTLCTLGRVIKCGIDSELIFQNPFESCKLIKTDKPGLPKYFTIEEVKKIEFAIKDHPKHKRFYPLFFTLVRTGMRSGELRGLEKSEIDFESKKIILPPEKTKARSPRIIPINDDVCDLLKRQVESNTKNNFVFVTTLGTAFSPKHINRSFRLALDYCEEIGVVKNTREQNVHSLRRTYISNLVMSGVEPQKIMRVVGHKNWSTMKKYLHLAPNYGNDIVDKLPY